MNKLNLKFYLWCCSIFDCKIHNNIDPEGTCGALKFKLNKRKSHNWMLYVRSQETKNQEHKIGWEAQYEGVIVQNSVLKVTISFPFPWCITKMIYISTFTPWYRPIHNLFMRFWLLKLKLELAKSYKSFTTRAVKETLLTQGWSKHVWGSCVRNISNTGEKIMLKLQFNKLFSESMMIMRKIEI
jgi:hypothetical protein